MARWTAPITPVSVGLVFKPPLQPAEQRPRPGPAPTRNSAQLSRWRPPAAAGPAPRAPRARTDLAVLAAPPGRGRSPAPGGPSRAGLGLRLRLRARAPARCGAARKPSGSPAVHFWVLQAPRRRRRRRRREAGSAAPRGPPCARRAPAPGARLWGGRVGPPPLWLRSPSGPGLRRVGSARRWRRRGEGAGAGAGRALGAPLGPRGLVSRSPPPPPPSKVARRPPPAPRRRQSHKGTPRPPPPARAAQGGHRRPALGQPLPQHGGSRGPGGRGHCPAQARLPPRHPSPG
ncbi:uncharacterized protein LOC120890704 [Ictidomys tridecemlineatus]